MNADKFRLTGLQAPIHNGNPLSANLFALNWVQSRLQKEFGFRKEQVLTIEDLRQLPLETIAIYLCLKAMATLILVIKLYLQL